MELIKRENNNHVKPVKVNEPVPQYGRVILTLKNCLLPTDKLTPTPSVLDGLDADTEADLRILGCELIQTAGILLRLPQVAMATAQVLFQRFYFSKSFVRQNYEVTGMGCLYLASKIEEAPRRIRDVINVYHHIKQFNQQRNMSPIVLDQNYINLKYQVIKAERRVLKELGFCVHVKHPHKLIVLYLQVLGLETNANLMQMAWNYMNDSLRTDVFVRYQPETIACACIYLTARKLRLALPKSPPWFSIFKVEEEDVQDVCLRILRLYTRSKPKPEELEKKIHELGRKFEETRLRSKTGVNHTGNNTPNSPSTTTNKHSPKRSRTRSRSRTLSDSPRRKKYKRSRSRSRSYDKYKKSRSRRSRSSSPVSKTYKLDKRYRSRSRSYDRDYKSDKYTSDRHKDDKYYKDDRYRRDDDRYRKDDDKYKKEDDYKYRKEDDYKYKKEDRRDDDRHRKDDDVAVKYRKDDDVAVKYRKDDDAVVKHRKDDDAAVKHRRDEERYNENSRKENMKSRKDEEAIKYKKEEEKYRKENDANVKNKREEDRIRKDDEKSKAREEESRKHKRDKTVEEVKKVKTKHSSSKHKSSGEKKKKKKHHEEIVEIDDDIEIIHVKKEKKSR